jgi:hypothetical protein
MTVKATMPRGSKPGERRGGRQRSTPNQRTLLIDRLLEVASVQATATHEEIIASLMTDSLLPSPLRLVIGRKIYDDARPGAPSKKETLPSPIKTGGKGLKRTTTTVDRALLPVLFGILADQSAKPKDRRQAALTIARYFLPEKPRAKKVQPDECGFVVDPDLARELRDLKLELACLPLASKKRSPHLVARKSTQLQKRIDAIQRSLKCPCPSKYRLVRHLRNGPPSALVQAGEIPLDKARLDSLRGRRTNKAILTPEEDLEEAIRTARYDSYLFGPESSNRERLSLLRESQRAARGGYGPRLSARQKTMLRLLKLLYPATKSGSAINKDTSEFAGWAIEKSIASAQDSNLPPSQASSSALGDDLEEFAQYPRYCALDRELSDKKGRTVIKYWFEDPNSLDEVSRDENPIDVGALQSDSAD